jgi:hypothetical protein
VSETHLSMPGLTSSRGLQRTQLGMPLGARTAGGSSNPAGMGEGPRFLVRGRNGPALQPNASGTAWCNQFGPAPHLGTGATARGVKLLRPSKAVLGSPPPLYRPRPAFASWVYFAVVLCAAAKIFRLLELLRQAWHRIGHIP